MHRIIVLDCETYYDDKYSLRHMSPWEYVADQRFELQALAWQPLDSKLRPAGPVQVLDAVQASEWLRRQDWSRIVAVAHNAQFDALVLARMGVRPARWFCTLQAAHQIVYPQIGSVALAALGAHFGLSGEHGAVNKRFLAEVAGRRSGDISPELRAAYERYVATDVEVTSRLVPLVMPRYEQTNEPLLIDWTIEQAVYPALRADIALLEETAAGAEAELDRRCVELGVDRRSLTSAVKFAALLAELGVDVPVKRSAKGEIPAVARTDKIMLELVEHDDPTIAALAQLRLDLTSTITRTRAGRLAAVARAAGGKLPVPLHWHKARTGRWTGAAKINMQNLSRGGGPLRRAIRSPDGQSLVVVDAAQIEARLLAAMAGADALVTAFAEGRDVYAEFASTLYGVRVTKETHPRERQVGKLAVLSLGYGCGAQRFAASARIHGGVELELDEAEMVVATYRRTYKEIPALWRFCDDLLRYMCDMESFDIALPRAPSFVLAWRAPLLYLPSGRVMTFYGLRHDGGSVVLLRPVAGRMVERPIWGGYLVENLVQATARDYLCLTHQKFRSNIVHQVHDELVALCEDAHADELAADLVASLRRPLAWLPSCPLDANAAVVRCYADAK